MDINSIIDKKSQNLSLSREEICFLVEKMKEGKVSKSQLLKFMQSINESNFGYEETYFLADAVAHTGKVFTLGTDLNEPVIDKHSAGLISDPTSLIAMPVLAACGVKTIKMISGFYGTFRNSIDRFEAIKNFNTNVSAQEFVDILKKTNMGVYIDHGEVAPVDRLLYNLRLEKHIVSIPLIAASFLAKKIACGANIFVFDVKAGEGSIGEDDFSERLAKYLTNVSKLAGVSSACVITNLNEPLGASIGNNLEMKEVILALKNEKALHGSKLLDVARELVIISLILSKKAKGRVEANEMFEDAIESGKAYACFAEFLEAYGANIDGIGNNPTLLDGVSASYITASQSGYVEDINLWLAKDSYQTLLYKNKKEKDKNAGVEILVREGEKVSEGDKIARLVFSIDNKNFHLARNKIFEAYKLCKNKPEVHNVFYKIVT